MPEDYFNRREPIHINCPYCWTEFQNFEQIGNRIRYQNKTYDHFEILPVMIEEPRPFIKYLKKFSNSLTQIKIECPGCKRIYHLELFPFNRTKDLSRDAYVRYNNDNEVHIGEYSLLDKLEFSSDKITPIGRLFDNYKKLLPYFILPFFFILIGILFKNENFSDFFSFFLTMFLFLGILLSVYQWQNRHFNTIKKLGNLPFLLHENYKKSYSFIIFQKKVVDRLGIFKRPNLEIFLFMGCIFLAFTFLTLNLVRSTFSSDNLLIKIGVYFVIILFLISFYIFYLVISVVGSSLLDFFTRLMYIFKNIPILLDPWEKDYGIKEITNIWSSTLITYYLGSWICPLILLFTYPPFFKNVGYFINEPNKIVIISHLFSNPFFLMIVLGNLFVIKIGRAHV
jgi:hypothetical protein